MRTGSAEVFRVILLYEWHSKNYANTSLFVMICWGKHQPCFDGLVQDCTANALKLLQSYSNPSIWDISFETYLLNLGSLIIAQFQWSNPGRYVVSRNLIIFSHAHTRTHTHRHTDAINAKPCICFMGYTVISKIRFMIIRLVVQTQYPLQASFSMFLLGGVVMNLPMMNKRYHIAPYWTEPLLFINCLWLGI